MKKLLAVFLTLALFICLTACGSGEESGGLSSDGEQAWTVKSAKYTYPSGMSYTCYSAEFTNEKFIMSNLSEFKKGEPDRDSIVFYLNSNGIAKMVEEEQDFGEDVEIGGETTFFYDEATETLTKTTMEDGKLDSQTVYALKWDDQERLSKYTQTNTYYYYDDEGVEKEDERSTSVGNYTYEYGAESYTITSDTDYTEWIDDEKVIIIRRNVATVPYDEKGDITTVESFFYKDGRPYDFKGSGTTTVKSESACNYWGYVLYENEEYIDGSKNERKPKVTFDAEGKVLTSTKTYGKSDTVVTFTYDENGNLTKMVWENEVGTNSIEFEWMKIPAKLDKQLAMFSGSPHWSVAEYIDNYVEFLYEGRLTVRTYKKADFLACIS